MIDNHLWTRPSAMLLDQDDDALLLGIKVSKSWLKQQSPMFRDVLLAMLAHMEGASGQA